jgi:DNA-binding NarL/FixJ family response regulator
MKASSRQSAVLPLPLASETWDQVAESLSLSPQQRRIVELILCGMQDKQIALELKLSVPTVRTHLGRVFARTGVRDRVELLLRILAASQKTGC